MKTNFQPLSFGEFPSQMRCLAEDLSEASVLISRGSTARSKGVNCQVHSSSSSSSFHRPISPFIYRHSRKLYKSRRTPSTQTLLMISSSEQLMDLLLALINIKLFKNFDGWPLDEPGFYYIFFFFSECVFVLAWGSCIAVAAVDFLFTLSLLHTSFVF